MTVAVCTLGCDRKASEGFPSWPHLFELEGDYTLYFNYEGSEGSYTKAVENLVCGACLSKAFNTAKFSFDKWSWGTLAGNNWRKFPQFDQDQLRLASIVCARNMCIEYALQTNADQLLFVDADIIPPKDCIPKMLAVMEMGEDAVCGLVPGRGDHRSAWYMSSHQFGDEVIAGVTCKRLEHANIGFTMLSKRLFHQVRFRYGNSEYPDGRYYMISDDPAYHLDAFIKFHRWPVLRMDVVAQHIGDLKENQAAQF